MKLKRLHLKNFRCFSDLTLELDPRLTVIIADNGAGKTAILDAIAIGFGRYLTKLPGVSGRMTKDTDIRISSDERREAFMMLAWEAATSEDAQIVWATGRKRDGAVNAEIISASLTKNQESLLKHGFKAIDAFTLQLVDSEAERRPYFLPVIAYYGTNRLVREEVKRRRGFRKQFSRFESLVDALDPDSRFRAAFEWFNAMEDQERREKDSRRDFDYRLPDLDLVRSAISSVMPAGFSNPRTEIRPLRFVVDRLMPDGATQTLRIGELSDGYRVVFGLVMDLARRMAEANGSLAADGGMTILNRLGLPAIVMIDEVDLHLHPAWQQHILTDLMAVFPEAQFIVTTHSPQVLSTINRENIRAIGLDSNGKLVAEQPLAMTYGEPSGNVLQSVMLVDPYPPIHEKQDLQRLTALVDQGQHQTPEFRNLIAKLDNVLGANHPQLQRLRRSIRRHEALRSHEA